MMVFLQRILVFYIALLGPASGGFVHLQGNPEMFLPGITKSLTLRCSVQSDHSPGSTKWNELSNKDISPNVDIKYIISILITRVKTDMLSMPETVAQISTFEPASTKEDVDTIHVDGVIEEAGSTSKELGYLQVTYDNPVERQSGIYTCDVNVFNSSHGPETVFVAVNIGQRNPFPRDFAVHWRQSEKSLRMSLEETKSQLKKAENEIADLKTLTQKLKNGGQMLQKGELVCNFKGSKTIHFIQPFDSPPELIVGISYLHVDESNNYSADLKPVATDIKTTGFKVQCRHVRCSTCKFVWLAFER